MLSWSFGGVSLIMRLWFRGMRRRLQRHLKDLRRPFAFPWRHYLLTMLLVVHSSRLPPTCDMSPSNCPQLKTTPGPHLPPFVRQVPSLLRKHAGVPSSVGPATLGLSAQCGFPLTRGAFRSSPYPSISDISSTARSPRGACMCLIWKVVSTLSHCPFFKALLYHRRCVLSLESNKSRGKYTAFGCQLCKVRAFTRHTR